MVQLDFTPRCVSLSPLLFLQVSYHGNISLHCVLPGEYLETILVGNKIDLPLHERQVSTVEGEGLAAELGVPFVETSALNGSYVENAFVRMTQVGVVRFDCADKVCCFVIASLWICPFSVTVVNTHHCFHSTT